MTQAVEAYRAINVWVGYIVCKVEKPTVYVSIAQRALPTTLARLFNYGIEDEMKNY